MRHAPTALPILLAAAALAQAGGVVKLDGPPKPQWVDVPADPLITTLSAEKAAKWVLVDDGPTADLRPAADGKTAAFAARTPGQYRVLVVAGEDVHRVRVVVPDAPQPMPPDPKPPEPKPPADPLAAKLQAAFDAEALPREKRADALKDKIELYKQASALALDPEVTTTGQLLARVRKAADALNTDRLLLVRKVVRAELQAAMPEDVPLDAAGRKRAAELFKRVQTCLQEVK